MGFQNPVYQISNFGVGAIRFGSKTTNFKIQNKS